MPPQHHKLLFYRPPLGPNLKGQFWDIHFRGYGRVRLRRPTFAPLESWRMTYNHLSMQSLPYLPLVDRNFNVKLCSKFELPEWNYCGPWGRKIVPIEISTEHFFSTSIHLIGLPCTVLAQSTFVPDRRRDRWPAHNRQSQRSVIIINSQYRFA